MWYNVVMQTQVGAGTTVVVTCAVMMALVAAQGVPVNGIETDSVAPAATSAYRHRRVTAWDLRDRTDGVGDLVQRREWLLLSGTAAIDITGNVIDVQDVLSGEGTVYLRLAPLPGSRNWDGSDFRVKPDSRDTASVA